MSLFAEELRHRIDEETRLLDDAVAHNDENLAEALRADLEDLRALASRHGARSLAEA